MNPCPHHDFDGDRCPDCGGTADPNEPNLTPALKRYLAWVKITGWTPRGAHSNTRLAAGAFTTTTKGQPLGADGRGPYRLNPGFDVVTELTKTADVLVAAGFTTITTAGKRGKWLDFRKPDDLGGRVITVRTYGMERVHASDGWDTIATTAAQLERALTLPTRVAALLWVAEERLREKGKFVDGDELLFGGPTDRGDTWELEHRRGGIALISYAFSWRHDPCAKHVPELQGVTDLDEAARLCRMAVLRG